MHIAIADPVSRRSRPSLNGKCLPIRLFLANESGYYLDISLYKEVVDPETGQMQFEAWGHHRQGPLHGLPISTPYLTKDYLQQKRFQAQSNGTTYVYDFPEMFRQVRPHETALREAARNTSVKFYRVLKQPAVMKNQLQKAVRPWGTT